MFKRFWPAISPILVLAGQAKSRPAVSRTVDIAETLRHNPPNVIFLLFIFS